jgi:hypothetical protein
MIFYSYFDQIKEIIILSQNSLYYTNSVNLLSINLGSRIESRFQYECLERNGSIEKLKKAYEKYIDFHLLKIKDPINTFKVSQRQEWLKIVKEEGLEGVN